MIGVRTAARMAITARTTTISSRVQPRDLFMAILFPDELVDWYSNIVHTGGKGCQSHRGRICVQYAVRAGRHHEASLERAWLEVRCRYRVPVAPGICFQCADVRTPVSGFAGVCHL